VKEAEKLAWEECWSPRLAMIAAGKDLGVFRAELQARLEQNLVMLLYELGRQLPALAEAVQVEEETLTEEGGAR